jgi:hypothetical protein
VHRVVHIGFDLSSLFYDKSESLEKNARPCVPTPQKFISNIETNPVEPVDNTTSFMAKETNFEFPIASSTNTPIKSAMTCGDGNFELTQPQKSSHNKNIPPRLLVIAQKNPFPGLESENPYHHLREFEQLCTSHLSIAFTPDEFRTRVFPFSLSGKSKGVVFPVREGSDTKWKRFANKFCSSYFPLSRIVKL